MVILGFGYKAQVGKDTASNYLFDSFSFGHVAFADKLKEITMSLFGLSHEQCYGPKKIKETVDPRYGKSPRQIMQELGENMRKIWPMIWVDTVFYSTIPQLLKEEGVQDFAISDVRYPNEIEGVWARGGYVIKVNREAGGTDVGADHSSETALDDFDDWDFELDNNGTFEEYYQLIKGVLEEVNGKNRKESRN